MAWRNLSRNKLRSVLATLGVIIGVGAIVALGILGNTLETSAQDTLGEVGNQVIISPAVDEGILEVSRDTVKQVERIVSRRGGVEMAPLMVDELLIEGERNSVQSTVYGTENPSAIYDTWKGRVPSRHTRGVILGSDLYNRTGVEVSHSITVGDRNYRVIGVIKPVQEFGFAESPNDAAVLPESEMAGRNYETIIIQASSRESAAEVADDIKRTVNAKKEVVDIVETQNIVQQIEEFFGLLNTFLTSLAGISLIVAAISILNVMLMSTVERKEEIGVLRAVGVQKTDVARMVLVEAAILGLVGGVLGIALGSLTIPIIYYQTQVGLDVLLITNNAVWIIVAFLFGIGTSILSGLYPAWKAANEKPVEALRS